MRGPERVWLLSQQRTVVRYYNRQDTRLVLFLSLLLICCCCLLVPESDFECYTFQKVGSVVCDCGSENTPLCTCVRNKGEFSHFAHFSLSILNPNHNHILYLWGILFLLPAHFAHFNNSNHNLIFIHPDINIVKQVIIFMLTSKKYFRQHPNPHF